MFKHFLIQKGKSDPEEVAEWNNIGQVSTKHKTKTMKECQEEDVEKGDFERTDPSHDIERTNKEHKRANHKMRLFGEDEPKKKFSKAVTAGSSQTSGSNMMHVTADGVSQKPASSVSISSGDVSKGTPEMMAEHFKKHPEDREKFHSKEKKKELHKAMCPAIKGLNSLVKSIAKSMG